MFIDDNIFTIGNTQDFLLKLRNLEPKHSHFSLGRENVDIQELSMIVTAVHISYNSETSVCYKDGHKVRFNTTTSRSVTV